MKKALLLSMVLFIAVLAGCGIDYERKAEQELEKILNESDYENKITYKGEGQNWKVNYIEQYTDIWDKNTENKTTITIPAARASSTATGGRTCFWTGAYICPPTG
ncbi:MAG: hypothetical protein PWQ97_421 [Tepidanaerobacteraceae bacterium]|nr:hypothetical protein [Tepidanaerobacteraceae bacterium]